MHIIIEKSGRHYRAYRLRPAGFRPLGRGQTKLMALAHLLQKLMGSRDELVVNGQTWQNPR